MDAKDYWQFFLETGAPEAYLLYSQALKAEASHVFDDQRTGSSDYGLQ